MSKLYNNWRSVGQSALAPRPRLGPQDQIFISQTVAGLLKWAPSLTKGRVCRLQLLLSLANAVILGSESHGPHDHILLAQIRDSPNLVGQVPPPPPPGTRWSLYPYALDSIFAVSYDSQGYGRGTRTPSLPNVGKSHRLSCDEKILWYVDPLLGNDREVSDYTTTVAK
jgi:hypothetical protein